MGPGRGATARAHRSDGSRICTGIYALHGERQGRFGTCQEVNIADRKEILVQLLLRAGAIDRAG
jgi:hypothetical protein